MTVMKFLKHIRSGSRIKDKANSQTRGHAREDSPCYGYDATARLPPAILRKIFIELCPLTVDDTYDSSEESMVDYGCALCDVKALAQCALVSRKWWNVAHDLLYEVPSLLSRARLTAVLSLGTEMFALNRCITVSANMNLPTNESANPSLSAMPIPWTPPGNDSCCSCEP
jgi:F-box-like